MDLHEIMEKLDTLKSQVTLFDQPYENRIYLSCESEDCLVINKFLWQDIGARFVIATAIDCEQYFEILYHYSDDESGCVINLKCFIRDHENPQVESITPMIPGAEWIEREMHDLEGIDFKNHPCLERLILADDWPEEVHPLRKDWNNEKEN
jgi:NADH:ubiquinone oxidoreductase subunit C